MSPLADMLLMVDDRQDVINMLERLETKTGAGRPTHIHPGMFKCMERLYDPADYETLLAEFMKEGVAATAAEFQKIVNRIVRRRNWTWLLMHPELTDADVHPSRRVTLPHPLLRIRTDCCNWVLCVITHSFLPGSNCAASSFR